MQFDAPDSNTYFEPWEIDAVKAVVAAFVAVRGHTRTHDFQDFVQEGLVAWWEARDSYLTTRGANRRTFLNRVVTNRLRDLRDRERAEKRTAERKALSLDISDSEDEPGLQDLIPDHRAVNPQTAAEVGDLRLRIDRARRRLSSRECAVLDGLAIGKTPTELGRELKTSRVTIYADLRRIRLALEGEGLREFLD